MLNDLMTSFELIILFPLYINNWIGGSVEGRGSGEKKRQDKKSAGKNLEQEEN